jgi:hypothetical protein
LEIVTSESRIATALLVWSRCRINAPFRFVVERRIYAAAALQNLKMRISGIATCVVREFIHGEMGERGGVRGCLQNEDRWGWKAPRTSRLERPALRARVARND